jgi:hypothetical protein
VANPTCTSVKHHPLDKSVAATPIDMLTLPLYIHSKSTMGSKSSGSVLTSIMILTALSSHIILSRVIWNSAMTRLTPQLVAKTIKRKKGRCHFFFPLLYFNTCLLHYHGVY